MICLRSPRWKGALTKLVEGWQAAMEIDPDCLMARLNRDLIEAELSFGQMNGDLGELKLAPAPVPSPPVGEVASLPSLLLGEGGPNGQMGGGVGPVGPATTPAPPPWPSPIEGEGEKRTAQAAVWHPCRHPQLPLQLAVDWRRESSYGGARRVSGSGRV